MDIRPINYQYSNSRNNEVSFQGKKVNTRDAITPLKEGLSQAGSCANMKNTHSTSGKKSLILLFFAGLCGIMTNCTTQVKNHINGEYDKETRKNLMRVYISEESDEGYVITLKEAQELDEILEDKNKIIGKYMNYSRDVYENYHKKLIETCSKKGKFSPEGKNMINTLLTEFTKQKPHNKYNLGECVNYVYEMNLNEHYRESLLYRYSPLLFENDGNVNETAFSNYVDFLNKINAILQECPAKDYYKEILYGFCLKTHDLWNPTAEKEEELLKWLKTAIDNYKLSR